jgi:hypothetical protein
MFWNDAADQIMLALWAGGNSLSVTAGRLADEGYNVSRSAVAGRIDRIKKKGKAVARATFNPSVKAIKKSPEPKFQCDPDAATVMTAIEVAGHPGVDYMDNENGCRATLDKRSGKHMLPMVCGLPRCNDYGGSPSSYCQTHFDLYNNAPPARRVYYG